MPDPFRYSPASPQSPSTGLVLAEPVRVENVGWMGDARRLLHLDHYLAPLVGCNKRESGGRYRERDRHAHASVDRLSNVADADVDAVGDPICDAQAVVAETEILLLSEEPRTALGRIFTVFWQLCASGMLIRPKSDSKQA